MSEYFSLVDLFPREFFTTEVTVTCGWKIDRSLEIEHFNQTVRSQVKSLSDDIHKLGFGNDTGTEGVY